VKLKKRTWSVHRGAIAVLAAVLLPVVLILTAFVINFAWIELSRTQTFIAADAATRAAGRTYAITGDLAQAKAKANEIAKLNLVAGVDIKLADSDFILGQSERISGTGRYRFTPGGLSPNALKVSVKKLTSTSNGSVPLIFPNFLEITDYQFQKASVSTRVEVDIAFVVDRSGSMIYAVNEVANGFPPKANPSWKNHDPAPPNSRWLDLASAANGFIAEMDRSVLSEYVSLTSYGTDVSQESALDDNYASVRTGLNRYSASFKQGKTNIGDGLQQGLNTLSSSNARDFASKVVILMTDGKLNAPPGASNPVTVASNAAKEGVVIFTITFADEADQALMQSVAAAGRGKHFHATSASSLTTVLETIVRMLPTVLTE
jgi:Ca-activated chloride channel homolog